MTDGQTDGQTDRHHCDRKDRVAYCSAVKIVVFEAPFGGLGATYDVHLRLIGSVVGHFLLVIIELFSLGAFVLSQFTL